MPLLHLLAGPNGAGKSSYVRDVLTPATHLPCINADEIAAERWSGTQAGHAYEGVRIAEAQRRDRIADVTEVFDNSSARTPFRLCAAYAHDALIGSASWPAWTPPALRGSGNGGERRPSKPQL